MATYGTLGYVKNGRYKSWMIQVGNSLSGKFDELCGLYYYILTFGPDSLSSTIDDNPNGYRVVAWTKKNLAGTEWSDSIEKHNTKFSPYENYFYDFDDNTVNLTGEGAETKIKLEPLTYYHKYVIMEIFENSRFIKYVSNFVPFSQLYKYKNLMPNYLPMKRLIQICLYPQFNWSGK